MILSKKIICQELTCLIIEASKMGAISASKLIGMGKKNEADDLAVNAMREVLNQSEIGMEVVIGEGEMDEAPMLFIGEKFGSGEPLFDIAVDPLEGTNLCANNMPNSLTTIAISEKGGFLKAPDCYMQKIASGLVKQDGILHIDAPVKENITNLSKYLKKDISDITVIMLDRQRHKEDMEKIRSMGARVKLISDGDIYGVVATTSFANEADLYLGSGGAPEGVLSACALKVCGGFMMGRLMFENKTQEERAIKYGIHNPHQILHLKDMVSKDCIFAISGVTNGNLLKGVTQANGFTCIETLLFSYVDGKPSISKITNFI